MIFSRRVISCILAVFFLQKLVYFLAISFWVFILFFLIWEYWGKKNWTGTGKNYWLGLGIKKTLIQKGRDGMELGTVVGFGFDTGV